MNRPEICRVTPFEWGETVQIFGENFTENSVLHYWRKSWSENINVEECGYPGTDLPELPPEEARSVKIRDCVNGQVAYVGSEADMPAGVLIFWIENEAGISAPFIANHPRVWNQSVTRIYPNGIVTVYGDCLWSSENKHAYLKNIKTDEYIEAQVLNAKSSFYHYGVQRHRANVRVPASIADGQYELYIHAGTAGEYGWSNPVRISVESEYSITEYFRTKWNRDMTDRCARPACETVIVNANPLGEAYDITDEIEAAIAKTQAAGGGIVMLSAGTFGISRTLNLRDGVVLKGAGDGATIIRAVEGCDFKSDWTDAVFADRPQHRWVADWKPHWEKYGHKALVRIYNDAGVEGIKFILGDGANIGILVASDKPDAHVFGAFANFVTVDGSGLYAYENFEFGNLAAGLLSIANNTELTLYKSKFIALQPVYLPPAYNCYLRFINNLFQCAPRNYDETFICGVHNSIFVENDFVDGRRSFMSQKGFDNNFVYQNRSRGVGRGANANEVYMSEHGSSAWCGYPKSIGESYVVIDPCEIRKENADVREGVFDNDLITRNTRYWICVLSGRGFGQYREIVDIDGGRLTLDKPWDILPDSTTAFTIVCASVNNIWLDNASELSDSHSQFIWNCGIENVIAGHEINMSSGILLYSLCYYDDHNYTCVVAFNRIVHCQVRGSGKGLYLWSDNARVKDCPDYFRYTGCGMFGNSVRACMFDGARTMHYVKNLPNTMTDGRPHCGVAVGGAFNTLCRNRIGGYTNAVRILDDCLGNCLDDNYYLDNVVNLSGAATPIGNDVSQHRIKL